MELKMRGCELLDSTTATSMSEWLSRSVIQRHWCSRRACVLLSRRTVVRGGPT